MSLRTLPTLQSASPLSRRIDFEPPPEVLQRFNPGLRSAAEEAVDNVIDILDFIGEDWWSGNGVTARKVSARLREIGQRDVVVNVNSPGGDYFEGVAIYNALRLHKGSVTMRVIGMAASAAATIAMSGDRIEIGRGAMMMIHNCWGLCAGDRHFLREVADFYEQVDTGAAALYADRSGQDAKAVERLMDATTWMSADAAIEKGFADALLEPEKIAEADAEQLAAAPLLQRLESALARGGLPRSERRALLKDLFAAKPGAGGTGTPSAADTPAVSTAVLADLTAASQRLQSLAQQL